MAGTPWTTEEDNTIRVAFWMKDTAAIAALLPGRTTRAVSHRAKALGLKKSPKDWGRIKSFNWQNALEKQLGEPICAWLGRRYVDEEATYRELIAEACINTRSLMKLMRQCDIRPISASEAVQRQMAANPNFLERMHAASHTDKAEAKRALTRQEYWIERQTMGKFLFMLALHTAGIWPVCELAVERFNIDFAFPRDMLAVELDLRWHRSRMRREADNKKDQRLAELGWTMLRLDSRTSKSFNVRKVSEALNELAGTHPR